MTFFKLLKCTVAKPPICCSCFCNEQLKKNVKFGKEYFTLNVSNIDKKKTVTAATTTVTPVTVVTTLSQV